MFSALSPAASTDIEMADALNPQSPSTETPMAIDSTSDEKCNAASSSSALACAANTPVVQRERAPKDHSCADCGGRVLLKGVHHNRHHQPICTSCQRTPRSTGINSDQVEFNNSDIGAKPRVPFNRQLHAPLTHERRLAIIHYHQINMRVSEICLLVGCSPNTAYHWIRHWLDSGTVDDEPRAGRRRRLSSSAAAAITAAATEQPFDSTPRQLRAKMKLNVSRRTIRRRLNDDGILGRKARHSYILNENTIRARLSFAHGYSNWTADDWMKVLFSDEKIFTLGPHGTVWVQRPASQAWNHKYCYELESHPKGVNFWCCFSGRGTGGCELFQYNNTGAMTKGILDYHLINSARKFYNVDAAELWWLLWDNSPIHKSQPVTQWLHSHGVHSMELPPYSPDLNPTENVFNDLARRVENRHPTTVDELEEAILVEWPLTDLSFLLTLAHSMLHRISAIIANAGHATKY